MNVIVLRKLDDLGRVVLPTEVRQGLNLSPGDTIDFCNENGQIILRKGQPSCVICNGTDNLSEVKGKHICKPCMNIIKES